MARGFGCIGVLALAACCSACSEPPGELIGAYGITMHLQANSCGTSGLPLPDGYRYAVELRADGPRGYWRVPKTSIEGTYDAGAFSFSYAQTIELGSQDAGTLGCTVLREEVLRGQVALTDEAGDAGTSNDGDSDSDAASATTSDAGVSDAAVAPLLGTHSISFRTNPDGRCAGDPGPLGAYIHLPCSADYQLVGSAHKPF